VLVVLDTDICIHLINRRSGYERVLRRISGRSLGEICISAISVSELRFGVAKSAHGAANAKALEEFLARFELLDYPVEASISYGKIRADHLERAGTPIGNNDLLIAAHAMAIKANVATGNVSEFQRIKGLKVLNWLE
jgi:tRNA(fMet)-specific endonuclease VapC